MKKVITVAIAAIFALSTFTSCRDTDKSKTQEEQLIEEMKAEGADIKIKTDGDETKIKMETEERSVKIKKEDGATTIKIDSDN